MPINGSLLPPNATVGELALEAIMSHDGELPGDIRLIKNPETCSANLLPWLAWEYAVTYWNTDWTETQKRAVIKNAAWTNKHRGTRGAVNRALLTVGFESQLLEWFEQTPAGAPYTFKIKIYLLDSLGLDVDLLDTFVAQIFDAKNCRSLLQEINVESGVAGEFYLAGAAAADVDVLIPADGPGGVRINGVAYHCGSVVTHLSVEIG